MSLFLRICLCIFSAGLALYFYVDKQNALTELRLEIPVIEKEVRRLYEENNRLEYEVDCFENPIHLMELLRRPEFDHLNHPYLRDVIVLPAGELPDELLAAEE